MIQNFKSQISEGMKNNLRLYLIIEQEESYSR